jgi:hypothetical protein
MAKSVNKKKQKKNNSCSASSCKKNCGKTAVRTMPVRVVQRNTAPPQSAPQPPQPRLTSDNSAVVIRDCAVKFNELFERYDTLRALARELNGLVQTAEYPAGVKIDNIAIAFTVGGQTRTATVTNTKIVGDIASLIANELNALVDQMYLQVFSLTHVAGVMQKAIEATTTKRAASESTGGASADNSTITGDDEPTL